MTYADIFLIFKNSKFNLGFFKNTLYIEPSKEGYEKEGYGNAIKNFLDSDTKDKNIYEQTNHLPPRITINSIRWESDDNNEIKKDILDKLKMSSKGEHNFPSGLTFYHEIELENSIEIIFNDLIEPKFSNNITKYLVDNKLNFHEGFFDTKSNFWSGGEPNEGGYHHSFDEKFHKESQRPCVIIGNQIKLNRAGYANNFEFFEPETSEKIIDNINDTIRIISELEKLGMVCYIYYIGGNGTRIIAYEK